MNDSRHNPPPGRQYANWVDNVLRPLLSGELREVPEGQGVVLLAADTDRTQDYVFESARLPEIRGASMLMTHLNKVRVPQIFADKGLPRDCIIYAGGGSLLALVPQKVAEPLRAEIEALYPCETGVATITCVSCEVTPKQIVNGYIPDLTYNDLMVLRDSGELSSAEWQRVADYYHEKYETGPDVTEERFKRRHNFSQMAAIAGTVLKRAKESKVHAPFHEALPHAYRCRSCQTRPAATFIDLPGERWQVCRVCERKLEERWTRKSEWVAKFETFLSKPAQAELRDRYYGSISPPEVEETEEYTAHDLGEIGQASRARRGYVGFIYADGNKVGEFVQRQPSPGEYKTVSRMIEKVTQEVVFHALAENLQPQQVERTDTRGRVIGRPTVHPFEILTVGGDDVLLIVPGDAAVPVAVRICQLFQRNARRRDDGSPLTMSAGIVIADAHNPVRFLHDMADELLKQSAKRLSRDKGNSTTFDFVVLKSQSMLGTNLQELRGSPPYIIGTAESRKKLQLTGCPYDLEQMRTLLRLLKVLRRASFPTSQIHALTSSLQEGQRRSSLFFFYQQVRLKERGEALRQLEEEWPWEADKDPVPWHRVDDDPEIGFRTILPDLADLYDFTPKVTGDELTALWQEILAEETSDAD